ncbi:hypothetical protein [Acetobacter sp. DsW_063]|uniref:hypothetical protein n=1 Tax=Acetobacter sp. DsW_063 TaxID=1514894 RepID=UPI000A3D0244|nr:hypothetical protein [Acetobacter sp. DsW_063]OUJ16471.1 hypothetical protein HK28_12370 [Acetobacter sp. DsW_063]
MTYLNHLTLNTAHIRRSMRDEVADEVVTHTRDLLDRALAAVGDADMPIPGYRLHVESFGKRRAMLCTIFEDTDPVVTFGVASRQSPALWRALRSLQAEAWDAAPMLAEPDSPWIAALMLPALMRNPASGLWIGDFERCAAWAWLAADDKKATPNDNNTDA